MITRIAIGLDGSRLSEKALPFVSQLAKSLKAKVLLLQICLWPEDYNGDIYKDQESGILPLDYLKKVKAELTDPQQTFGLAPDDVEVKVGYRKSTYELGDLARSEGADLLVMTTHGRSGLSLLVLGSIATGVLKHTTMPVIIIQPEVKTGEAKQPSLHRMIPARPQAPVMVTLDGSAAAEASLVPAAQLSAQLGAPLYLVEVINSLSPMVIATMSLGYGYAGYDEEKEIRNLRAEAETYLKGVKEHLHAAYPLLEIETSVLVGDPSAEITEYSRKLHPLCLAMATHARSELGQFFLGSVAEQVVRDTHLPVLLTRIPKGYLGFRRRAVAGKTPVTTAN
jgi:nucleotide-binding universal stress UspA family protein